MKALIVVAAVAAAISLAGPVMASPDDYPELRGFALATPPLELTDVAYLPASWCRAMCPDIGTLAQPARGIATRKVTVVAKAKTPSWDEIIPYNY